MGLGGPNMWDLPPAPVEECAAEDELKVTPTDFATGGHESEEEEKTMVITGDDLEFHR